MRFFFILAGFFLLNSLFGQGDSHALKLNSNFYILKSRHFPYFSGVQRDAFSYKGLSVGLVFPKNEKSWYREIELSEFIIRKKENEIEDLVFGVRYEMGKYFRQKNPGKLKFKWGAASRLYYFNTQKEPKTSSSFPEKWQGAGITLSPVIHAEYSLTSNFFLNARASFSFLELGFDSLYVKNPALTERQRKFGSFDFGMGNIRVLTIGIGYFL
ncbi:MAG: hypothetical protein GY705_03900 [Bacteroidetes bacterium]|nr:hypothetical protein [Bacteroidota bacterium]